MEVGKVLRPGDKGTKRILHTYGDSLICVRYRYDKKNKKRFTTAEIIIDEKPWIHSPVSENKQQIEPERVLIRVSYGETELRTKIKSLGGRWDRDQKLWKIAYQVVKQLHLEERIVKVLE